MSVLETTILLGQSNDFLSPKIKPETPFKNSMHFEILNPIHIAKPRVNMQNYETVMRVPSLLGMDFLERYKIYFEGSRAILKK
jgi:hypothetical protein